jgi:hypothetical protein
MAKSLSTATTKKKGSATPQESKRKVSAHKRRTENRLLFRDLTERFVSKLYVESPPTAPPTAAGGGVEAMKLVKMAKDPAMVRKKRQLQRQRQKLRKRLAVQKARKGEPSVATTATAMETVIMPTRASKAKAKPNTASQQQASLLTSNSRQGGMLSFAPATFHPTSPFVCPQGGILSFAPATFVFN